MPGTGEALPESIEERIYAIHFDAPAERKAAEVDELCSEHPEHASAIRKRMRALRRSDSVLGQVSGDLQDTLAGERIGAFTVQSVLGEGGFGTVYLAEQQEPVRRQVALKVLQAGRGDTRSKQRFEDERQVLAQLQHACIAQIYDAGVTPDSVHYFAMEYVDGRPITDWCDEHRTDVDGRLRLFVRICGAILHAHQRGVVHRDIKPSNVLVREEDGEPMPKVIDFGIAKLFADGEDAGGAKTQQGNLIGTPGYMSPEQAAGDAIDTRTDVYSLGVLLCELLTGRPPLAREQLAGANLAKLARLLAETTPRRPSQLIEGTDRGDDQALRTRLREDLDWIVLRAVATDREQRYPSVAAMAEDVERHLRGMPVMARQQATAYLVRKFVRKHRVAATVALLVLGLLFAAIGSLAWGLSTSHRLRGEAEDRERASRISVAQLSLNGGDANTARIYLESVPEDERGWEWRHLAAMIDSSTRQMPAPENVLDLIWLDERRLLTMARLDPPEIWDVQTGERLATLPIQGVHRRTCFDRDTMTAIVAQDEGWAIWDLDAGVPLTERHPVPSEPLGLAWSEDRKRMAISGKGGWLWIVDVSDPDGPVVREERLTSDCNRIAFVGDDLLLGYHNGEIERTDSLLHRRRWMVRGHADDIDDLLVDETRGRLYSASIDGTVRASRLDDGEAIVALDGKVRMRKLVLSADGSRLYVGGGWATAAMLCWETETFRELGHYHGHELGIRAIALSPDGKRIASVARDQTVRIWPPEPRSRHVRLDAGYDARRISVSPDTSLFGTASMRGRVTVWNAQDLAPHLQLETGGSWSGNAMSDDVIYVCGRTAEQVSAVQGYALGDGRLVAEGTAADKRIESMLVDPESRWLLGGHDRHVLIWSLPDLQLVHEMKVPVYACRLIWEPESRCFVIGGYDATAHWIDPEQGKVVRTRRLDGFDGPVGALALRGDVSVMGVRRTMRISGGPNGPIDIASPNNWAEISPDGTRLITGGADCAVRTWDLQTGDPMLALTEPVYSVIQVRLADGGRRILGLSHRWSAPSYVFVWSAPDQVSLGR